MRFYKSPEWAAKRREVLERDRHECQRCKEQGGYSRGNTVHHLKHLDARPDLALADDNLLTVCEACHNVLHPERLTPPQQSKMQEKFPERW